MNEGTTFVELANGDRVSRQSVKTDNQLSSVVNESKLLLTGLFVCGAYLI
jgi:hypothetical protein